MNESQADKQLFNVWVVATTIGVVVSVFLVVLVIEEVLGESDSESLIPLSQWLFLSLIEGAIIGISQAYVLRESHISSRRWLLATLGGFVIGTALWVYILVPFADNVIKGLTIGLVQWLFVLRHVRSVEMGRAIWIWPISSGLGWGVSNLELGISLIDLATFPAYGAATGYVLAYSLKILSIESDNTTESV